MTGDAARRAVRSRQPMGSAHRAFRLAALVGFLVATPARAAEPLVLRSPVECAIGARCFLQSTPDQTAGAGVSDSVCGQASYEEHDGVDIRVPSFLDVAVDVPVVAVADGTVLRARDGEPDALKEDAAARAEVAGRECGNGVVIAHAGGVETQVCHLKAGSIRVRTGEPVAAGAVLGAIGASGAAQFPHVHFAVRIGGRAIDPLTGAPAGDGCRGGDGPRFDASTTAALTDSLSAILGFGLAGAPVDTAALRAGAVAPARAGVGATVLYVWASNVQSGDRFRLALTDPDGERIVATETDPMAKPQAERVAFAGRKRPPVAGRYAAEVAFVRDGRVLAERQETFIIGD